MEAAAGEKILLTPKGGAKVSYKLMLRRTKALLPLKG
jgi:hypothetical protein